MGIDFGFDIRKKSIVSLISRLTLLIGIIVSSTSLYGQNIEGVIRSTSGESVSYVTVYVKSTQQGAMADESGHYSISLEEGDYELVFRCLGFKAKSVNVTVGRDNLISDIVLERQINILPEVIISTSNEDPAYSIMRRAIGMANYHLREVDHYTADLYMKGSVTFHKIPKIIARQIKKRGGVKVEEGSTFIEESFNLVTFDAPDKYTQKVISVNSSVPGGVDYDMMEYIGASFYAPNINIMISPLAPNAFSHYDFKYEGYSDQVNFVVNKIKVTPKRKSKQLFTGYIYILEGLWSIYNLNLSFESPWGSVSMRQQFEEIEYNIWLPISQNYKFEADTWGVKADVSYNVGLKYEDIKLNERFAKIIRANNISDIVDTPDINGAVNSGADTLLDESGVAPTVEKPVVTTEVTREVKRLEKIDNIMSKDNFSMRDMNRLSRLIEKEGVEDDKQRRESLEISSPVSVSSLDVEERVDSTFWNSMRTVPLSEAERVSLAKRDSLELLGGGESDAVSSIKRKLPLFLQVPIDMLGGKRWHFNDNSISIKYRGVFDLDNFDFNAVDGFNYSLRGDLSIACGADNVNSLSISSRVGYAFSREEFIWRVSSDYLFAPMSRGVLKFEVGDWSSDFTDNTPINHHINSLSSLLFKENYKKYYGSRYVSTSGQIDVVNGFYIKLDAKYKDITELSNSSDYSFFNRDDNYSSNVPVNSSLNSDTLSGGSSSTLSSGDSFTLSTTLTYTPEHFYRIKNGRKRMSKSRYPTSWITYKMNRWSPDYHKSSYSSHYIEGGVTHDFETAPSAWFKYRVRAGGYINSGGDSDGADLHFSDYTHFKTDPVPLKLSTPTYSYLTTKSYELSSNRVFLDAAIRYKSPYIALKYLPGLTNTLIREIVWLNYYTSPSMDNHYEVGYALSELLYIADIGVVAGFNGVEFDKIGFYLLISL